MSVLKRVQQHWLLCTVVIVAALVRLLFLFDYHELWWDSGVYMGMAKYIWSGGSAGLWEHIRPVLWPAVLGAAWWLKLNMVWFARILEFLLSLVSIGLVYVLGRRLFSQRTAVLASIVWAFSAIAFYLSFHEYTELPAVTLVLAALVAFVYDRPFIAGLFVSLAFLMKFPAGIFIAVLALTLVARKQWKMLVPLGFGFAIPTAAYLVFNHAMYGTALGPLFDARESILNVLGCNVLRFKPWWQYLVWIVVDNWLNVAALVGLGAVMWRWKRAYVLPVLAVMIPAAYVLQLHCRDYRYLMLFLPFIVLFTGHGIALIISWLERRKELKDNVWPVVVLIVIGVSVFHGMVFYHGNESRTRDLAAEQYAHWIEGKTVTGEVWSSNPIISGYTDAPVQKIYYPLYEYGTAIDFNTYLAENEQRISAVFLDNCGGGIICAPDDAGCVEELQRMRSLLNEHFKQVFFAQSGTCWYAIFTH